MVVVATFGPSTGWIGKSITFEAEQFVLEGHGPITPDDVMEYDRQGHLVWPYDGMRAWVAARAQKSHVAPTPETQPVTPGISIRDVEWDEIVHEASLVRWSCLGDDASCPACRALEGAAWLPGSSPPAWPPLSTCTSPEGCRCATIAELGQAGPEPDDVAYVRALGGVATPQQMAAYEATLAARQRAQRTDEDKVFRASDAVQTARRLEKTDPDKSIAIYKESLAALMAGMQTAAGEWLPSHIHYSYNRLTMLLEKQGSLKEALQELDSHDALGIPPDGPQATLDAMTKRRARLAKKLAT